MPNPKTYWLTIIIVGLAFIGFADATFLTVEHFTNSSVPCFITTGCDTVTTSSYSTLGPIPVALLGALYYLAMLIFALLYLDLKKLIFRRLMFWFAFLALADSLYFFYLQAFVLHAYCIYCLISAVVALLIFLCTLGARFYRV